MIVAPFRHDSWIFPEKSGASRPFPAFPARSRPGSSLEMCGFSPAEKAPSKGNVGGTPVQPQYRGTARRPSPLFLKTGEISARTRSGKEPGQWQYALPAREISSKAALWGGMGPVTVPRYGASVLPSLPENGGDFGENKARQRTGAVAVRRYGAAPVLQHGRSSQPKDQALP